MVVFDEYEWFMKQQVINFHFRREALNAFPLPPRASFVPAVWERGLSSTSTPTAKCTERRWRRRLRQATSSFGKLCKQSRRALRTGTSAWEWHIGLVSRLWGLRSTTGEDIRKENRRLKVISDNLCKRNLIKAEKQRKLIKTHFA